MKNRGLYIIIAIAFFLQPFLAAMLPAWLVPNLIFTVIVVIGLIYGESEDMVIPLAWLFGLTLLSDVYSGQYVGVSVIASVLSFALILLLRRMGNIENLVFSFLLITAANLTYFLTRWVIYAALSSPYSFLYMLVRLPFEAIPNILLALAAVFAITRELIQERRDKYFR